MTPDDKHEELDKVRQRFLDAEKELKEAVAALSALQTASSQLADARGSVVDAAQRLAAIEGGLAKATDILVRGAADLRAAIEAIFTADPARLRGELELHYNSLVQSIGVGQKTHLDAMDEVKAAVRNSAEQLLKGVEATRSTQATTQASVASLSELLAANASAATAARQQDAEARALSQRETRILFAMTATLSAVAAVLAYLAIG